MKHISMCFTITKEENFINEHIHHVLDGYVSFPLMIPPIVTLDTGRKELDACEPQ